jgi:hypothetical protein
MPLNFDLEDIRKKFNCVNYFETGLWDPRTDVSSKNALRSNFKKVYCIEIRQDWVEMGRDIFKKDIESNRYNLILDDSTNMKQYLNNNDFKDRTLFFLDAHVDNQNIHNYKKKCPLVEELDAIKSLERKDNIILIDDLRILAQSYPWGEDSYGNINFTRMIMDKILSINPAYNFDMLDGYVKNDVLMAYI